MSQPVTHPTCQCPYKKEHGYCHQDCMIVAILKLDHPRPVIQECKHEPKQ